MIDARNVLLQIEDHIDHPPNTIYPGMVDLIFSELKAYGFAIVPIKPTEKMIEASALAENAEDFWADMIGESQRGL